jgi:hypothetical protein
MQRQWKTRKRTIFMLALSGAKRRDDEGANELEAAREHEQVGLDWIATTEEKGGGESLWPLQKSETPSKDKAFFLIAPPRSPHQLVAMCVVELGAGRIVGSEDKRQLLVGVLQRYGDERVMAREGYGIAQNVKM